MGRASKIVYYKRQLHSGVNINTFLEYISSLFRNLEIFSEQREKYVDNEIMVTQKSKKIWSKKSFVTPTLSYTSWRNTLAYFDRGQWRRKSFI